MAQIRTGQQIHEKLGENNLLRLKIIQIKEPAHGYACVGFFMPIVYWGKLRIS